MFVTCFLKKKGKHGYVVQDICMMIRFHLYLKKKLFMKCANLAWFFVRWFKSMYFLLHHNCDCNTEVVYFEISSLLNTESSV